MRKCVKADLANGLEDGANSLVEHRYDVANSVKVGERTRRARGMPAGTGREYNVIGGRLLPP